MVANFAPGWRPADFCQAEIKKAEAFFQGILRAAEHGITVSTAKEEDMKTVCQVLFWLGIFSIPLAWLMWYFGAGFEMGRQIMGDIADPALQAALKEAHAERWGIFVGVWPVTLLVLSNILEKKSAGN